MTPRPFAPLALLALGACSRSALLPPAPVAPAPLLPATLAPSAASRAADLRAQICAGKAPCEIRKERPAGADARGRRLSVATVYRGYKGDDDEEDGSGTGAATSVPLGITEEPNKDSFAASTDPSGCQHFEYVLVTREGDAIAATRPLFQVCNEGHGAAGVGYDEVTFGSGTIDFTSSGGSNWRWSTHHLIALAPLHVRLDESQGFFKLGANTEQRSFDWDEFSGKVGWYSPACPGEAPPDDPDDTEFGPAPRKDELFRFSYVQIPAVEMDPTFVQDGWKSTELGRCSARVDSAGKQGFVVHGKPGAAEDAAMRVVATKAHDLFVEIHDDKWVGPGKNWIKDDHLELWVSANAMSFDQECLSYVGDGPLQWGVRIADGQVFAGKGAPDPKAIRVEKLVKGNVARLHLRTPPGFEAITVVYSDSDDGKTQKRMIATSNLVFGEPETLGALSSIDPEKAICRMQDGKLEPVLTPPPDDAPLFQ